MDNSAVVDDNPAVKDNDRLPIGETLTVLKYRTIKKNNSLGWWSAIVLLEDHGKKQVCFYRWRRNKGEWKRDKKLPFKTRAEWAMIKEGVEAYINELE
jgi:hypothetical protein